MHEKEIELKIRALPEDLKREVLDYMEFLLKKYRGKELKAKRFKFDWGVYRSYGRNSLPLSYNTELWSGDNVFSGYECVSGSAFEAG